MERLCGHVFGDGWLGSDDGLQLTGGAGKGPVLDLGDPEGQAEVAAFVVEEEAGLVAVVGGGGTDWAGGVGEQGLVAGGDRDDALEEPLTEGFGVAEAIAGRERRDVEPGTEEGGGAGAVVQRVHGVSVQGSQLEFAASPQECWKSGRSAGWSRA